MTFALESTSPPRPVLIVRHPAVAAAEHIGHARALVDDLEDVLDTLPDAREGCQACATIPHARLFDLLCRLRDDVLAVGEDVDALVALTRRQRGAA